MQNPFITIWTQPKQTLENFIEKKDRKIYGVPFFIIGSSLALDSGLEVLRSIASNPTIGAKILIYLFLTLVYTGILYIFLGKLHPWLIKMTGNIWNGRATRNQIANVNALSCIPYGLILIYQIVLLMIGLEPSKDLVNPLFSYLIWIVSFRILIIGISIAQKFGYGLALLNIFISILPLIILQLWLLNQ